MSGTRYQHVSMPFCSVRVVVEPAVPDVPAVVNERFGDVPAINTQFGKQDHLRDSQRVIIDAQKKKSVVLDASHPCSTYRM